MSSTGELGDIKPERAEATFLDLIDATHRPAERPDVPGGGPQGTGHTDDERGGLRLAGILGAAF